MSTSDVFFRSMLAGESQKATTPLVFPGGKPFSSPAAAGPKFVQAAPPAKPALSGDIEADYKDVAQNFANYIRVMETRKDQVDRLKGENRDLKEQNDKLMKRVSDFEDVDSDMRDLRDENKTLRAEIKEAHDKARAMDKQTKLFEKMKAENLALKDNITELSEAEEANEIRLTGFQVALSALTKSVQATFKGTDGKTILKLIAEANFPKEEDDE